MSKNKITKKNLKIKIIIKNEMSKIISIMNKIV